MDLRTDRLQLGLFPGPNRIPAKGTLMKPDQTASTTAVSMLFRLAALRPSIEPRQSSLSLLPSPDLRSSLSPLLKSRNRIQSQPQVKADSSQSLVAHFTLQILLRGGVAHDR